MVVYILYSSSLQRYYVGQTSNFDQRLARHNQGLVLSTKRGTPWSVKHTIEVETRSEAMNLEKKIKGRGAKRYLEDIGM
jgi:putative endonuclease